MAKTDQNTPTAIKVHVSTGRGLEITWLDGHQSLYPFGYLRDACPCAACGSKPSHGGIPAALPLYRGTPTPRQVEHIGKYALQFIWNDGHDTGIYSFDYLREICPCPQCKPSQPAKPRTTESG
jgi:DUF971 family protein